MVDPLTDVHFLEERQTPEFKAEKLKVEEQSVCQVKSKSKGFRRT